METVIDPRRLRRLAHDEGNISPVAAKWVEDLYVSPNVTPGWALAHLAPAHSWNHFGEAGVVHGMLGVPDR